MPWCCEHRVLWEPREGTFTSDLETHRMVSRGTSVWDRKVIDWLIDWSGSTCRGGYRTWFDCKKFRNSASWPCTINNLKLALAGVCTMGFKHIQWGLLLAQPWVAEHSSQEKQLDTRQYGTFLCFVWLIIVNSGPVSTDWPFSSGQVYFLASLQAG